MKPILFFLVIAGFACRQQQTTEIRDDFKKYYDQYGVTGSFVLYDEANDKYVFCNRAMYTQAYTPASTFKICNTLIGLETGVIRDEQFVIPWDSVVRNPVWDKDYDLQSAFANSVVWYYQELARRAGGRQMKEWIDRADYGNKDTSGGIDQFWLSGGLRITPEQQIGFLKRLHHQELPFSARSVDILKKIMIVKDTAGMVVRGKTGWGGQDSTDIGWYVGYVESGKRVYYFANCIQTESKKLNEPEHAVRFDHARTEIADLVLRDLGILKH